VLTATSTGLAAPPRIEGPPPAGRLGRVRPTALMTPALRNPSGQLPTAPCCSVLPALDATMRRPRT